MLGCLVARREGGKALKTMKRNHLGGSGGEKRIIDCKEKGLDGKVRAKSIQEKKGGILQGKSGNEAKSFCEKEKKNGRLEPRKKRRGKRNIVHLERLKVREKGGMVKTSLKVMFILKIPGKKGNTPLPSQKKGTVRKGEKKKKFFVEGRKKNLVPISRKT